MLAGALWEGPVRASLRDLFLQHWNTSYVSRAGFSASSST